MASLSIIIVNYKNPPLLRLCLASLSRALSPSLDCEIIVVDSQTSVETQNVVREEFAKVFSQITLLPYKENTGYTRGNNEGIRYSHGEYILVLNPDTVVRPGALEQMRDYLAHHPDVGLIGPQLMNFDETVQHSYFRFYNAFTIVYRRIGNLPFASHVLNRFLMRDVIMRPDAATPVDWLMGSVLMTSRRALDKVGLMDERMFHYFSEVDWARRFWENGYAVAYYPAAQVYHYLKRGSKGHVWFLDALLNREARWHIKDGFRYLRKYGFFNTKRSTPKTSPILT